MNSSSSTPKLIAALVCAAGLRVFFFPDAAGPASMALMIGFGVLVLSILYIPWLTGCRWLKTLRDVGVVLGVNLLIALAVGIVLVVVTRAEDAPDRVIVVANVASMVLGFTLVGVLTRNHRIPHLARVCVGVWLLTGLQLLLAPASWRSWLLGFFMTCAAMWAGCGASWILRKPDPAPVTPEADRNDCQSATPPHSGPAAQSPQG